MIADFHWSRSNQGSTSVTPPMSACMDFLSFGQWPNLQRFLALVQDFQYRLELGQIYTYGMQRPYDQKLNALVDHVQIDKSTWMDKDPTKVSAALIQLRSQTEAMLCEGHDHKPNCPCKTIQELYGQNLYRCDRHFCQFYGTGFATRIERDVHIKVHSRPYMCPHTDCLFAVLGFKSPPELERHREETHLPHRRDKGPMFSADLIQQVSENEMKKIIKDAVRQGDTDTVMYLLENFNYPSYEYLELQRFAATHASRNTVSYILEQAQKIGELEVEEMVIAAIRGENILALHYLVIKADEVMSQTNTNSDMRRLNDTRFHCAVGIGNVDIMEILINDGRAELPSSCPQALFHELLNSKRDDTEKVRRLCSMKKYVIWPEAFTDAVYSAALTGSTILVQACLDCGGSANAIYKGTRRRAPTPALYGCVRKGTRRHAEVVKLLLQNGADPNGKAGITKLKGMSKIEQHFGMSWEDLVIQTQGNMNQKLPHDSLSHNS